MMKLKSTLALGLTLALTLSLSACAPKEEKPDASVEQANAYVQQLAGLDADTVLFTVNGQEVTAEYYLYWLTYDCYYWDYMNMMYTGAELDFTTEVETGVTTAQFLRDDAKEFAAYYILLEQQSQANDCGLTEAQQTEWDQAKADYVTENGQEAFDSLVQSLGVSLDTFNRIRTSNYLYQNLLAALVAAPTEEDLESYITANDLYLAKHILLATASQQEDGTVLLSTGAAPANEDGTPFTGTAEEYNRQVKAKADDLLAQIDAAEDPIAKFDELMLAESQDSGLSSYPDGYTFSSTDSLVDEFKDTVYALEYNAYSGVVESDFGYHIILRLRPDVSEKYTTEKMDALVSQWLEEAEITTTEAFDGIDAAAVYANYKTYQAALADSGEDADPSASPDADGSSSPDAGGTD